MKDMSKYCMKCGTKLEDSDLFCDECGAPVSIDKEEKESTKQENAKEEKKKPGCLIFIAVVIFCIIALTMCGNSDTEQAAKVEVQEEHDTVEDKVIETEPEVYAADFIGQTTGTVLEAYGLGYSVDYYEGSYLMRYNTEEANYVFFLEPTGSPVYDINGDEVISSVITYGDSKIVLGLNAYAGMTYNELKESVSIIGDTVPTQNEVDYNYEITFNYGGYKITYTWNNEEFYDAPAASAWVR